MRTALKIFALLGIATLAALTLHTNGGFAGWDMTMLVIVLSPYAAFCCATLIGVRLRASVFTLISVSVAGFVGLPAYRDLKSFGEAGAPMYVAIPLIQGLLAVLTLLFASADRWWLQKPTQAPKLEISENEFQKLLAEHRK